MDYPYENLGPERFQIFCQALIQHEYADLQAFPVGQPDAGRDALSFLGSGKINKEFVVFQVKYARDPSKVSDPNRWLEGIIASERPKIARLVPRGAKRFVLITNVRGSGHGDTGSLDRINRTLEEQIPIPAVCWWRDDLNRRLDNAWSLKWVYPELLSGPDLIRALIEAGVSEDRDRRAAALRAFVAHQHSSEKKVRFRQVELQNDLIDLFIDVPVLPPQGWDQESSWRYEAFSRSFAGRPSGKSPSLDSAYSGHFEEEPIGAAIFLLSGFARKVAPLMALEGAPGQGKSTVTQFVCQVHRMRLLRDEHNLRRVSQELQSGPLQLPVRIDLRDYATWIGGRDPFSRSTSDSRPAGSWPKSLESFLSALVQNLSGGLRFDAADLVAVLKQSPVLLVLDGLDEVADISRRKEVVDEVLNGVRRLQANTSSLQVVVTSRPAAFANSPGLPESAFPHFQLGSVSRPLIDEYARKWIKIKNLPPREGSELIAVLSDKLRQPHFRDLARNPMQLAIVLSLIHTKGSSLPDKRTALYDTYVDVFFDRESEKSRIVREHREVLINIHRYLAWVLHTEAEQGNETGSIDQKRLIQLLGRYLEIEGYDPRLVDTLFTGIVERVVAIVSRVQGTFEFEVQPLREYFAARFLYETAPYSPPGRERPGTKPERFAAIARDFYWLNVTRFFAGCYSKGELASLIDGLRELLEEEGYRLIAHPRLLAVTLLADWVFSQHPRSAKSLIEAVLDGDGLSFLLFSQGGVPTAGAISLPEGCGRRELVERCFRELEQGPPEDVSMGLLAILRSNAVDNSVLAEWKQRLSTAPSCEKGRWIRYGMYMGFLRKKDPGGVENLLEESLEANKGAVAAALAAGRVDLFQKNEGRTRAAIEALVDGEILPFGALRARPSALNSVALAISPVVYSWVFEGAQPFPLKRLIVERLGVKRIAGFESAAGSASQGRMAEFLEIADRAFEASVDAWASELAPWDQVVEGLRANWGDCWASLCIANLSAGIRSDTERCRESGDLLDSSLSLCRRARFARLRSGSHRWWSSQLSRAGSVAEKQLALLVLLTWGSARTLCRLSEELGVLLNALPESQWYRLASEARRANDIAVGRNPKRRAVSADWLPESCSERLAAILEVRFRGQESEAIWWRYLRDSDSEDMFVMAALQEGAMSSLVGGQGDEDEMLSLISKSYRKGVTIGFDFPMRAALFRQRMPVLKPESARKVMEAASSFPLMLVAEAESVWRGEVAKRIVPVGRFAAENGWDHG